MRILSIVFCLFSLVLAAPIAARAAVPLLDTYYSPKNSERPNRPSTKFIILHTTEGPARGSGSKLQRNGEAHFMVDEAGRIYRIIDRKRVAYHCGRSMWNGLSSLDNYSVGIEVVGYHNKDLTAAQYKALKALIAELKKTYRIRDNNVLTHSMVAYGAPNQWHKRSHRGRKRCGMRMALPSVRKKLGVNSKPAYDPDVRAGRLVVADKALQQLLYSVEKKSGSGKGKEKDKAPPAKQPAKPQPQAPEIKAPSGKTGAAGKKQAENGKGQQQTGSGKGAGKQQTDSKAAGKRPDQELTIGIGQSAWDVARGAYNAHTTLYVFPNGEKKRGDEITNWRSVPSGTRVVLNAKETGRDSSAPQGKPKTPTEKAPAEKAPVEKAPAEKTPAEKAPAETEALDEAEAISEYAKAEAGGNVIGPGKSAWDIARDAYNAPTTIYTFPNGEKKRGDEIKKWNAIPAGTQVSVAEGDVNEPEKIASLGDAEAGSDGAAPPKTPGDAAPAQKEAGAVPQPVSPKLVPSAALVAIAGSEWNSERTIYVTEKGECIKGNELDAERLAKLTPETKVFSGYKVGGPVTPTTPAFSICGPVWRDEGTQFLFPDGHLESGDKVDPKKIPSNTMILYKD